MKQKTAILFGIGGMSVLVGFLGFIFWSEVGISNKIIGGILIAFSSMLMFGLIFGRK